MLHEAARLCICVCSIIHVTFTILISSLITWNVTEAERRGRRKWKEEGLWPLVI